MVVIQRGPLGKPAVPFKSRNSFFRQESSVHCTEINRRSYSYATFRLLPLIARDFANLQICRKKKMKFLPPRGGIIEKKHRAFVTSITELCLLQIVKNY